jgi:hypothetical protein
MSRTIIQMRRAIIQIRRSIINLAIIAIFLNGCKKSPSAPPTVTIPTQPPAVTAVGTPVGTPVTKTIGPGGGTVLSADGRLQLSFPPNALTTNTDITIQPGTNNAPGGRGFAYHLMPEGTTFGVPVTLTFNYSDSDAYGTLPYFFYIAYQDSTGVWEADFKNRTVDTIARTASLTISHFSWWDLGTKFSMYAYPSAVRAKKTSTLGVEHTDDQGTLTRNPGGEFSYSKLPPTITPVPSSIVGDWSIEGVVGGNAQNGTVSQDNETETYTAPAEVDEERTVQASGTVTYDVKAWNNGQLVSEPVKFILFTPIDLLPSKFSFIIRASISVYNTSGVYNDFYVDSTSFQVDVDLSDSVVTCSAFTNQPATVTPPSGTNGQTKADWINDGIGLTNVTSALGVFYGDSITIVLGHTNTVTPKWKFTSLVGGTDFTDGGDDIPGYPTAVVFAAVKMAQTGTYINNNKIVEKWSATPIN